MGPTENLYTCHKTEDKSDLLFFCGFQPKTSNNDHHWNGANIIIVKLYGRNAFMLISFCQYIHVHLLNTLLAPTWRSTMSANVTLTCTTFKCTQVTQQTNKWKKQRNATYKQPNNQSCIDMILKWNDDYIKFCCCDVVPEAGLTYPSVLLQRILLINLKRHLFNCTA